MRSTHPPARGSTLAARGPGRHSAIGVSFPRADGIIGGRGERAPHRTIGAESMPDLRFLLPAILAGAILCQAAAAAARKVYALWARTGP